MGSNFFNNTPEGGGTLFEKLQCIAKGMGQNFHTFKAVSGYFQSTGYYPMRGALQQTKAVRILVGISHDEALARVRKGFEAGVSAERAREQFARQAVIEDVCKADYVCACEKGPLQMLEDLKSGLLEIRIHTQRNIHAKFYLCLTEHYDAHQDGWVIMGSSNMTESGLGIKKLPRYELNVALKDPLDIAYCNAEFERLWEESVPFTPEDMQQALEKTYLATNPTPYELYIRALIDTYGIIAEDDYSVEMPEGYKDLKYQRHAVTQGFSLLRRSGGFILADVVGLGKTPVAAMVAKRFIEANGPFTKALVVHPPAVELNWKETFKAFGIYAQTHFVSTGSLKKVTAGEGYCQPGEYSLVIVDESHAFSNHHTIAFDLLQRICKSGRPNGQVPGVDKKVILLTATLLQNSPEDIYKQLLLFQDDHHSTIDGIPSLSAFFKPLIKQYQELKGSNDATGEAPSDEDKRKQQLALEAINDQIRRRIIEPLVIRRTRTNIEGEPEYREDLEAQGIRFPRVGEPIDIQYELTKDVVDLLDETVSALEEQITFARYRVTDAFVKREHRDKYKKQTMTATNLAGIMRTHLVKRLESSFEAFKTSLAHCHASTKRMIEMLESDRVLIVPQFNLDELFDSDFSVDDIIAKAQAQNKKCDEYCQRDFNPDFLLNLKNDEGALAALIEKWSKVTCDSKLETLLQWCNERFFQKDINPSSKLVLFSESVDTLKYLRESLIKRLGRQDILMVTAENYRSSAKVLRANFDANSPERANDYNILLCSDALAEGVNLHLANSIVNYDIPWNAVRLMQRIGRVNRIGSTAEVIRNYVFYPSDAGNRIIGLLETAFNKIQSFHGTLGEDAKIISRMEVLHTFKLYQTEPTEEDNTRGYISELCKFRREHPVDYERIKELPPKTRVLRKGAKPQTLVYSADGDARRYQLVINGEAQDIPCHEAFKLLKASPEEAAWPWSDALLTHNRKAIKLAIETPWRTDEQEPEEITPTAPVKGRLSTVIKLLKEALRHLAKEEPVLQAQYASIVKDLIHDIERGVHAQLPDRIRACWEGYDKEIFATLPKPVIKSILDSLREVHRTYITPKPNADKLPTLSGDPSLVISETFI